LRRTLAPTIAGYLTAALAWAIVPAALGPVVAAGRMAQMPTLVGIALVHFGGLGVCALLRGWPLTGMGLRIRLAAFARSVGVDGKVGVVLRG
jgi:hypothetical protein